MKSYFKTVAAALMALCVALPAMAGEKCVGVTGGIKTRGTAPVAGVYFQLGVIPHLRVVPALTHQFRKHGTDGFAFNLDVHSPWRLVGSRFSVYPLAGLNISRWNVTASSDTDTFKTHADRLGFNVGGGVEWRPSAALGLKISAEGKYRYNKDFDTGVVTLGIGYVF